MSLISICYIFIVKKAQEKEAPY